MKESFAIVASVLAFAGNLPYLYDVIREKIHPHPYTWLMWSIVSCVIFFGQLEKGAGWGALPTGVAELFTILIFLFSLKHGFKYITKKDTSFLLIALFGIIPWILTNDPTISVIIVVSIDIVAFIPTMYKASRHRGTETPILYSTNIIRHILTLFAMQTYNIATSLHAITMIVANTIMTFIIIKSPVNTPVCETEPCPPL